MTNEQKMMISSFRAEGMGYGLHCPQGWDFGKYSEIILPQERTAAGAGSARYR